MMLTVALVDDHPLFREGLRAVLSAQPDVEVVAEASDSRQACAAVASTKPAVVVIDMTLPDGDGIAATQEVLRQAPRTRVLMLTMHTEETWVRQAFDAGAKGYVLKNALDLELSTAKHHRHTGNSGDDISAFASSRSLFFISAVCDVEPRTVFIREASSYVMCNFICLIY